MASHTTTKGDVSLPIGIYTVQQDGQPKEKRRHRQIGVLQETDWGDGRTSFSLRMNIEIFTLEIQALMRANGILNKGDDSILCAVYERKAAAPGAAAPAAPAAEEANEDQVPF